MMPVVRANIGGVRLALGMLALAECVLAMWFSALGHPLIYGLVVVLLGLWIGLWPFDEPKLGRRLFIALVGSVCVCIVLLVIGEAIAFVRRDGLEEFGPLLFVPAFMIAIGLPITALAMGVAAIGPRLLKCA